MGAVGLCQLERSFSHLTGVLRFVRGWRSDLLGDGGLGGEKLQSGCGFDRQGGVCGFVEVWRELLADRGAVHRFLFGDLPFPDVCSEVFYGSARNFAGVWRVPVEHADAVCHDCDAAVWVVGGSRGQAGVADDAGIAAADSGVSDDGLHARQLVCADGDDGRGVFVDPGGDVAVGGLHCGSVEAGHGVWIDDHDPEYWVVWTESTGRVGE